MTGDELPITMRTAGLRPTKQRVALGRLLFLNGDRHFTAEILYEEALQGGAHVSLATVYNTVNQLADLGLLRRVSVDGTKTYYDTNVSNHHHFYFENGHELVDIQGGELSFKDLPPVPEGYEIERMDVVIRLRRKRSPNDGGHVLR